MNLIFLLLLTGILSIHAVRNESSFSPEERTYYQKLSPELQALYLSGGRTISRFEGEVRTTEAAGARTSAAEHRHDIDQSTILIDNNRRFLAQIESADLDENGKRFLKAQATEDNVSAETSLIRSKVVAAAKFPSNFSAPSDDEMKKYINRQSLETTFSPFSGTQPSKITSRTQKLEQLRKFLAENPGSTSTQTQIYILERMNKGLTLTPPETSTVASLPAADRPRRPATDASTGTSATEFSTQRFVDGRTDIFSDQSDSFRSARRTVAPADAAEEVVRDGITEGSKPKPVIAPVAPESPTSTSASSSDEDASPRWLSRGSTNDDLQTSDRRLASTVVDDEGRTPPPVPSVRTTPPVKNSVRLTIPALPRDRERFGFAQTQMNDSNLQKDISAGKQSFPAPSSERKESRPPRVPYPLAPALPPPPPQPAPVRRTLTTQMQEKATLNPLRRGPRRQKLQDVSSYPVLKSSDSIQFSNPMLGARATPVVTPAADVTAEKSSSLSVLERARRFGRTITPRAQKLAKPKVEVTTPNPLFSTEGTSVERKHTTGLNAYKSKRIQPVRRAPRS